MHIPRYPAQLHQLWRLLSNAANSSVVLLALVANIAAAEASIDPISDQQLLEDGDQLTIELTGLQPGDGASITTLSTSIDDNSIAILSVGSIIDTTASLLITSLANAFGQTPVTVTVTDSLGGNASAAFQLTVLPVNDAPSLDAISDQQLASDETRTLDLTGIGTGASNEIQSLSLSAMVADSTLPAPPQLQFLGGENTATLTLQAQPDASGDTSVAVFVTDDGGTDNGGVTSQIRVFTVQVGGDNQTPTLINNDPIPVGQGSSALVSSLYVDVSDDGSDSELTFTVSNLPSQGELQLGGTALQTNDTFTQADITAGNLRYQHQGSTLGSDTVDATLRDTEGLGFDLTITFSIVQTAANEAPQLAIGTDELSWQEGDAALRLAPQATVVDAEGNIGGGRLQVQFTTAAEDADQLWVDAVGGVTVSGVLVSYNSQALAVLNGGSGSTALVASLDQAADLTAVQALLRAITFTHNSNAPQQDSRSIQFSLSDNANTTSSPVSRHVNVVAVNNAPVLDMNRTQSTWQERDGNLILDPAISLSDPDSDHFAGGSASLNLDSGSQIGDRLLLAAGDRLQLQDDLVLVDDKPVATYASGGHNQALQISWSAFATPALAQEVLRALAFLGSDDEPIDNSRQLTLSVSDDGEASASAQLGITVVAVNDAPQLSTGSPLSSWREGDGPQLLDAGLSITDRDSADFAGGVLQISLDPAGDSADLLRVVATSDLTINNETISYQGLVIANGNSTGQSLALSLLSACTPTSATALLRQLAFDNTDTTPGNDQRGISIRISDGDGASSDPLSYSLTVSEVNAAPVLTLVGDQISYVENADPEWLFAGLSASDNDHSDLGNGQINCQINNNARAGDRLRLVHEGIGIGEVGLSEDQVLYGGAAVGSVSGQDTSTIQISLNTGVSPDRAARIIRRLAYAHDTDAPGSAPRSIAVTLSDPAGASGSATVQVNVQPENDAPTASSQRYGALSRRFGAIPVTYQLAGNDPDGDPLSWSISANATKGTVSIIGDSFTYLPDVGAREYDNFAVVANDGNISTASTTLEILITDVDDARLHTASDAALLVTQGEPWTYTPRIDRSELSRFSEIDFFLLGTLPGGLGLHTNEQGDTSLDWSQTTSPGHHRFGLLFTDRLSGWSGYQPLVIHVVERPGGDG